MSSKNLTRRGFLKTLGIGAVAVTSLRFVNRETASESDGSTSHQWAMVIDQSKCVGCGYCTKACKAHNDVAPSISWNKLAHCGETGGKDIFLPSPCMHCAHAPCVDVCPVKASYYRPDGIVMMDYDRCIGCRYCEVACPYLARSFNWEEFDGLNPEVPQWGQPEVERRPRGVVEKCSFCYQRIDRGLKHGLIPGVDDDATPACVVVCPMNARIFGDLNDPESNVSKALASRAYHRLREDLGTGPRVYYLCPQGEEEST